MDQEGGGGKMEKVAWKHTRPYVKQREVGIRCVTQGAQTGALGQPRGIRVGWGGSWVQEGGDIRVPVAASC